MIGGGGVTEYKMCFDFLYNFCLKQTVYCIITEVSDMYAYNGKIL